jgi:hypothetical protein
MSEPAPGVFVNSFGGVGSKTFVRACVGRDGRAALGPAHGHLRTPPASVPRSQRVVYLLGDPWNAVISFFGRRGGRHERHGFDGRGGGPVPHWAQKHCRNIGGDWRALSPEWDLAAFLAGGRDLFRLEDHYANWRTATLPYPILFVRFEDHWRHLPAILDFLELPGAAAERFPPPQKRSSDWTAQPDAVRAGLDALYGGLRARLLAEPPVFVHPAGGDPA